MTEKDELLPLLKRKFVECGINPDDCDLRQLKSCKRLIETCEKRVMEIDALKKELKDLIPNKTEIAELAGLGRTTISDSHNQNLARIYNSYFLPVKNESITARRGEELEKQIEELKRQNEELKNRLVGKELNETRYLIAQDTIRKLENKVQLQAKAISNQMKINAAIKQQYLEQTGEELKIDIADAINGDCVVEEENLMRKIGVSTTTAGKPS